MASDDPRLSLQERYGDHDGDVRAVRKAAQKALAERFLPPADAQSRIRRAEESSVLTGIE